MDKSIKMSNADAIDFLKDIAKSIEKEKAIDFKLFYKKEEHTQLMAAAYVQALEMAMDALRYEQE